MSPIGAAGSHGLPETLTIYKFRIPGDTYYIEPESGFQFKSCIGVVLALNLEEARRLLAADILESNPRLSTAWLKIATVTTIPLNVTTMQARQTSKVIGWGMLG